MDELCKRHRGNPSGCSWKGWKGWDGREKLEIQGCIRLDSWQALVKSFEFTNDVDAIEEFLIRVRIGRLWQIIRWEWDRGRKVSSSVWVKKGKQYKSYSGVGPTAPGYFCGRKNWCPQSALVPGGMEAPIAEVRSAQQGQGLQWRSGRGVKVLREKMLGSAWRKLCSETWGALEHRCPADTWA